MTAQEMLTGMHRMRRMYEKRMEPVMEKHRLTRFECDVLGFLHNNPGMDTANCIVEYRMLPKANVSKAVDSLEKRGFVTLSRDKADRRKIHIALAEAAAPVVADILDAQIWFSRRAARGLSEGERQMFADLLRRITANADNMTEETQNAE